jgi:hypothetical protein
MYAMLYSSVRKSLGIYIFKLTGVSPPLALSRAAHLQQRLPHQLLLLPPAAHSFRKHHTQQVAAAAAVRCYIRPVLAALGRLRGQRTRGSQAHNRRAKRCERCCALVCCLGQ